MPLIKYFNTIEDTHVFVWDIIEPDSYFIKKINLTKAQENSYSAMTAKRRTEWLLPRYLTTVLFDHESADYQKDQYSKPFLNNCSHHISISHSHRLFAFIYSPFRCGIDIQFDTANIKKIARRFTSDQEINELSPLDSLTALRIIWSVKESLYKSWGRKSLDFKDNLNISKKTGNSVNSSNCIQGIVSVENTSYQHLVRWTRFNNYTLAYVTETT